MEISRLFILIPCLSLCLVSQPLAALPALDKNNEPASPIQEKLPEQKRQQISITVSHMEVRELPEENLLVPPASNNEETQAENTEASEEKNIPQPITVASVITQTLMTKKLSAEARDKIASQNALEQAKSGAIETAYATLRESLNNNAYAHQSRQILATLLLSQQEFAEAEYIIDQGLALAPDSPSYKKIKARILLIDGKAADALASLLVSPPKLTDDLEYFELLASLLQLADVHDQAIEIYESLLRINFQEARWWTALGVSLESIGNNTEALSSFQAALLTQELTLGLREYSEKRISYLSRLL